MMGQVLGNTAGKVVIAITIERIGNRFGLHNGQQSIAAQ